MFLKLCKHELKCSYRNFLILYAITLLMALVMNPESSSFLGELSTFIYAVLIVTIGIMCIVVILRNFHSSMFSRSSYLTHTLPVSSTTLLLTKLFGAVFWVIISSFIVFLTFVLIGTYFGIGFNEILNAGNMITSISGVPLYMIYMFISLVTEITLVYLIMCVVHTKFIQRFRTPIGILLYVFIAFVYSSIETAVLDSSFGETSQVFLSVNSTYVLIAVSLVFLLLYFFSCRYLIDHKLEIE